MGEDVELKALCFRCGAGKSAAPDQCLKCGFKPSSNTDLAKSFILSAVFEAGTQTVGRPPAELLQISHAIIVGVPYEFADSEVASVEARIASFRAITPRRLAIDLFKWIAGPVFILAIVYALLHFS